MELHTSLRHEVAAFDFPASMLVALESRVPGVRVTVHDTNAALLDALPAADLVATWDFDPAWYAAAPRLRAVMTPAAGDDWARPDPSGRVLLHRGRFHGPLIAESLLAAMLMLNRRMLSLVHNQAHKRWDRDAQFPASRLAGQHVVIVGYGAVGAACGDLLERLGCRVTGVRRHPDPVDDGRRVIGLDRLDDTLESADHLVLVLPATAATDQFLDQDRLARLQPGCCVYNFGRGNAIDEVALFEALVGGRVRAAALDVTAEEPLQATSPLWSHPDVLVMPHSSCVYEEYRPWFLDEVVAVAAGYQTTERS